MKIKALAALVKQSKMLHVINLPDAEGVITQWASTGQCMYLMHGIPFVEPQQLLRLLDVAEADMNKYDTEEEYLDRLDTGSWSQLPQKLQEFWESESEDTDLLVDQQLSVEWFGEYFYLLYDRKSDDVYGLPIQALSPLSKSEHNP